jgi:hypothetical protein
MTLGALRNGLGALTVKRFPSNAFSRNPDNTGTNLYFKNRFAREMKD